MFQAYAVCCRWLLVLFLCGAIVMSGMAVSSCRFMKFVDANGDDSSVGLYRFYDNDSGQCMNHPDGVTYNESTNAARMGGVVAFLAGCTVLLLELVEFCCCRLCCSGLVKGVLLLVSTIMQGLTFLVFGSVQFCDGDLVTELLHQTPCTVDEGAIFSAMGVVFFFLSGVLVNCTPRPDPVKNQKDVEIDDDASITSTIRTKRSVSGGSGQTGGSTDSGEISEDASHKHIV